MKSLSCSTISLQIPTEAGSVAKDIERRLLEGDEDSRFIELLDSVVQEVQREHRLARAGCAADQRAAADRKAALAHIIEALDPGRELLNLQLRLAAGRRKFHDEVL